MYMASTAGIKFEDFCKDSRLTDVYGIPDPEEKINADSIRAMWQFFRMTDPDCLRVFPDVPTDVQFPPDIVEQLKDVYLKVLPSFRKIVASETAIRVDFICEGDDKVPTIFYSGDARSEQPFKIFFGTADGTGQAFQMMRAIAGGFEGRLVVARVFDFWVDE